MRITGGTVTYPSVHIVEECMREGMQIESADIAIADKIRLLDSLSQTGLKTIVVGSFVSPRYTPQMAAIDELMAGFSPRAGVTYTGLALNDKGRERAAAFTPPLAQPAEAPVLSCSLCDTFMRRNVNITRDDEIARWTGIVAAARATGAEEAGIAVNAAFGSNFEGAFSLDQRMELLRREHALWDEAGIAVTRVMLGDPMSWCQPHLVAEQVATIRAEWPAITYFHLHVHDGRGLALASIYAALSVLDDACELQIETTAGGVGGCPYCGNGRAAGMAATEDVVGMLESMGIENGVDLDRLIEAVWLLEEIIGRPAPGHVSKAGPLPHGDALYDANLPLVETFQEARHFRLGADAFQHEVRPWREPIPSARQRAQA
jgi:hydroxymethylglutaryl-CoA lyase